MDLFNASEEELAELEKEERLDSDDIEDSVPIPIDVPLYTLLLDYSRERLHGIYEGGAISTGTKVITETRYGSDIAEVRGSVQNSMQTARVVRIERLAVDADLSNADALRKKEAGALLTCKARVQHHGLGMKLICAHYLYDGSKLLFFYTADGRVDFRALVKDLVGIFATRIELRQVSARDEVRIANEFGVCGRRCCCSSINDKLKTVSIKMAKEQNLSLNTAKISGPCGRLLCCLAYEHNFYCAERRNVPQEGTRIEMEGAVWKVKDLNLLKAYVTLVTEDGRMAQVESARFKRVDSRWQVGPAAEKAATVVEEPEPPTYGIER